MAGKIGGDLIAQQAAAYFKVTIAPGRSEELAAETGRLMARVAEAARDVDFDADPYAFAAVLDTLKDDDR